MEAFMFFALVCSQICAYVIGYTYTEVTPLSMMHPIFKFKMFECRKCFTFHCSWVLNTFVSLLFNSWIMFAVGILFAVALFVLMHIDEKNRMIEDD